MPAFKGGALAVNIGVVHMACADERERLGKVFGGELVGVKQVLGDGLGDGLHGFQAA